MNSMACALKRSRRKRNPYARLSRFQKKSVRLNFLARCSLSLHYKILLLPCTLVHRNASYSRFALSLITTLFLRAFEIGHPDSAVFASSRNLLSSTPGTFPLTESSIETTFHPCPPRSKVETAFTSSFSGGVLFLPRVAESAIAKQDAWAAANSSSGLVFPLGSSVLEAQVTGRSENAPLPTLVILPVPLTRSPSQITSAVLCAAIIFC